MKKIVATLLCGLLAISMYAQGVELRGSVKLSDGTPVEFATVRLLPWGRTVAADERGVFSFQDVQEGGCEVEVSAIGVVTRRFPINLKKSSKPFTFRVEQAEHSLDQVTVTAQTVKLQRQLSGFAVDVIEPSKVAVQSVETNELLARTAGVLIRQDGGLGSRTRYSINGFADNSIKIFIDGVPASNYGSSFSLNSIPPAMIERIEVYKGVVPGHLTDDALGGAINVILKERRRNSLMTSYSFGSFNTHRWTLGGAFHGRGGFVVDASAFYNYSDNDYEVWGRNIYFKNYQGSITESDGRRVKRFNDGYRSVGGKVGVGFEGLKWADKVMLSAVLSDDYKEIQNGTTMEVVYGNRHYRRSVNAWSLDYLKEDFLTKGLSLKLELGLSNLKRQNIDTVGIRYGWNGALLYPDGSYVMYNSGSEANSTRKTLGINRERTYLGRTNIGYRFSDNHRLYLNYMFNSFERKNSDEYLPLAEQLLDDRRDLQKQVGALTYENSLLDNRLKTTLFYKHYHQRVTLHQPSYNTALQSYITSTTHRSMNESGYGFTASYALLPNLYIMAAAERALRMPNEHELFGNTTQDVLATPDLRPEESLNANIGVDFRHTVGSHSFGVNASVYFRDTRDMIREIFSAREEWSSFSNMESVETKGIDAELFYNWSDKLTMRFNISKFDVLYNTKYDPNGHAYNYYRTQIPNEPSFKFNANVSYTFRNVLQKKSRLSLYYNVNYVEKFLRNWSNVGSANLQTIPTQYPMTLGATYHFPGNRLVLNLDAKNLLDQQIYDNFGLQKPGRSFYVKLTYFIL